MHKNQIKEPAPRSEGHCSDIYEDEENKIIRKHEENEERDSAGETQKEAADRPENTSDEEQEELPYDGALDSRFYCSSEEWNLWDPADTAEDCPNSSSLGLNGSLIRENTGEEQAIKEIAGVEGSLSSRIFPRTGKTSSYKKSSLSTKQNLSAKLFPPEAYFPNSRIPDVLLRHFYQDPELNLSQFIDSETIPDTSLAESSDETIVSRISNSKSDLTRQEAEHCESFLLTCQASSFNSNSNVGTLGTRNEITTDEAENATNDLECPNESFTHESEEGKFESQQNLETLEKERNYGDYRSERRTSPQEVKYGQGPVHYRLPDFSKVPSKVKIPKKTGSTKAFPVIKRAMSSPNLIGRSSVVKDILEDMPSRVAPETTKLEQEMADDMNHLHAFSNNWDSYKPTFGVQSRAINTHAEGSAMMNSSRPSSGAREERLSLQTRGLRNQSEGERMSEMLREQAEQLKIKVFQHLKGCLETLEQNYLSKKEKHRYLQLQNSNTRSETVGVFDPDRLVESEIFRLGMLLEDVKERIDNTSLKTVESKREEDPKEISLNQNPNTKATLEQDQNSHADTHHQPRAHAQKDMEHKNITTVLAVTENGDNASSQERTPSPEELVCSTLAMYCEDGHLNQDGPESHDEASWTDTADVTSKTESLASERLPDKTPTAKELQDHMTASGVKGETDSQETHIKPLDQDSTFGQAGTKGCLPFLERRIPTTTRTSYISHNCGHNKVILNVMNEARSFNKTIDSCLQRRIDLLEVSPNDAQLVRKQENELRPTVCRTGNLSDATLRNRRSKQKRIEIVIKQEAANSDLTEAGQCSSRNDSPFPDLRDVTSRRKALAQSTECCKLPSKGHVCQSIDTRVTDEYTGCNNHTDFRDLSLSCALSKNHMYTNDPKSVISRIQAYSPRKMIYAPISEYKSDLGPTIFKRKNFATPKTYYSSIYDTVMFSPQYITRGMYVKNTLFNAGQSHLGNVDSMILNSILDQAIQTAESMKKTTERMIQTVSADLAKVQCQRSLHKALISRHAVL